MPKPRFRTVETARPRGDWARRATSTAARGGRRVREAWVEAELDDQWMVAYRVVPGRHREPIIAELRIFPLERTRGRPPGRWSADVLGIEAQAPDDGISADVVRRVSVGEHRLVGQKFARWLQDSASQIVTPELLKQMPALAGLKGTTIAGHVPVPPPPGKRKRGRPPIRSEQFYAKLARDYAQRVAEGSPHPTADLARRRRWSLSKVRNMLHEARRRGLLSPTAQGRSGGGLTDRALAILKKK